MSGHLEEAAGALNAAAGQVPVDLVNGADQHLGVVVQHIQQAGGPLGEQLTGEVMAVQIDLQSLLGRLAELQGQLQTAAQQVMQRGG
jgi:hypothetical protein